jgi:hypothetical protein
VSEKELVSYLWRLRDKKSGDGLSNEKPPIFKKPAVDEKIKKKKVKKNHQFLKPSVNEKINQSMCLVFILFCFFLE